MKGENSYKVIEVDSSVLHDYDGMNYHAAKALGFKEREMKPNEILVRSDLKSGAKSYTIKHEIKEAELMKKGAKYFDAHVESLSPFDMDKEKFVVVEKSTDNATKGKGNTIKV